MPDETSGRAPHFFRTWFGRPPRAHGEAILDRRVSPLELLYDLVFAAVIAQAGLHLSDHVSLAGLFEFAVVFSLTWIAWANGSLYLELHGRNDGRTRSFFFLQIAILVVLTVYSADVAGNNGRGFALAYTAFLVVMTWLWYDVRRQDALTRPEFLADTARYVVAMLVSVVVILATAFLPGQARLGVWAVFTLAWMVLLYVVGRAPVGLGRGMAPTDSLVERFGTITIIVLGEVIFGVVDGLSRSARDFETIATGMIALFVGFGLWWVYFDFIGRRLPKRDGGSLANWILCHHPFTLAIAAAGAGMVSLLEHAHDGSTPAASAWLLSGAVAVGLISLIPASRALTDAIRYAGPYRRLAVALAIGAALSALTGWARPAPWLLALLLVAVLALIWSVAVLILMQAGDFAEERPAG